MAEYKSMIPYINCENEGKANVIKLAKEYYYSDADQLFLYNHAADEASKTKFIALVKELIKEIDLPIIIGLRINKLEDIKKALYTGAMMVVIPEKDLDSSLVQDAAKRFGKEKIIMEMDCKEKAPSSEKLALYESLGGGIILLKHTEASEHLTDRLNTLSIPVIVRDSLIRNDLELLLESNSVLGVSTNYFEHKNLKKAKKALKEKGIAINTYESSMSFSEFKLNSDGLIPVVVQDYKTNQVLMVAYMNEEAYIKTLETGCMTYYSRSRQELWVKGMTSGHFQYVKALTIDCDNDTILAKVLQIGAACHTGNTTCFSTELMKKKYDTVNPLTVLSDVYDIILHRKEHPKEGSYTNYLFDQGMDKILKKCGEEAAEIIIAAKNPESGELKYEISDFIYHLTVLMVECGLDWKDVMKELAHRR